MALIKADRVKETSTSTGTGNFTLDGAVSGYRAFSAVMAVNDTFFYTILHSNGVEWETGYGTLLTSTTFERNGLHASSSGTKHNFSAGTKGVFISQTAAQSISGMAKGSVNFLSGSPSILSNLFLGTRFMSTTTNLNGSSENIAIGHSIAPNANSDNGAFNRNVSIGSSSLARATASFIASTGSVTANVAIGWSAGLRLGLGSNNIFVGRNAGGNFTVDHSHNDSIFIGNYASPLNAVGDDNCIVIGSGAIGNGPFTTTIGGNGNTDVYLVGNVIPTGAFKPASIADASAPTNAIYYSTTASKLVYKDASGNVNNLY